MTDEEEQIQEDYNADDKEQVNKARKKAKREQLLREQTIREIMKVKEIRAWLYHILEFSEMFVTPHVPNDVYATHINIGRSEMGKFIWTEIESAAPELCVLMRKEAKKNVTEE